MRVDGVSALVADALLAAVRAWARTASPAAFPADVSVRGWTLVGPVTHAATGRCLLWSRYITPAVLQSAARQGYGGVVGEEAPLREVLTAFQRVSQGRRYGLERRFREPGEQTLRAPGTPRQSLTSREREVLLAYARDHADLPRKDVARVLGLSENSLKTYLSRIRAKLPARSVATRYSLYTTACAWGLVEDAHG